MWPIIAAAVGRIAAAGVARAGAGAAAQTAARVGTQAAAGALGSSGGSRNEPRKPSFEVGAGPDVFSRSDWLPY